MPIALRSDYDAARLRAAARRSQEAGHTRRLLALAAIYDGATRSEAAAIGGVTLQIVRDWVLKLNERGPDGLVHGKALAPSRYWTTSIARHWCGRSRTGRFPRCMGWFAGGSSICASGCVTSSRSPCPSRRLAANCEHWGIEVVGPAAPPCTSGGRDRGF
jgi:Homeodomain-like domain